MNLSDLPIGTKAKIRSTRKGFEDYSFVGEVKVGKDSSTKEDFVWLANEAESMGYLVRPEYDSIWRVEILKK